MRPIDPILEKLEKAQTAFFRCADSVPMEHWSTRPGPGQWSAAELSAHLIAVERDIVSASDRVTQKVPRHIPAIKRFHLPMWLVQSRFIRRKSPIPTDNSLLGSKEEMLAELRGARERSLAFLDEPEGPGSFASSGWRASSLKWLARICQDLGGGEVLNEQLLGCPLGNWTEFVTVVGSDDHDVPGEPGRITKVERIGYRVIFSNGDRRTLVRARVRIAP